MASSCQAFVCGQCGFHASDIHSINQDKLCGCNFDALTDSVSAYVNLRCPDCRCYLYQCTQCDYNSTATFNIVRHQKRHQQNLLRGTAPRGFYTPKPLEETPSECMDIDYIPTTSNDTQCNNDMDVDFLTSASCDEEDDVDTLPLLHGAMSTISPKKMIRGFLYSLILEAHGWMTCLKLAPSLIANNEIDTDTRSKTSRRLK